MRKAIIFLLSVMMVATAFVGCKQAATDEFIILNGAEPETLDPHLISGVPEHRITYSLFEGLVSSNPETAEAEPGVAESWEVNSDGTVYTFKLRKDAIWSDGVKITAQTVVDSWLRMLDPEMATSYAWFPSMFLKGAAEYNAGEAGPESVKIKAVDDRTFQMELVGPLPYVLGALSHYSFAIVPLHAIEKYGKDWTSPENFVGNGPFTLNTWKPQEEISVTPNDKYWDKGVVKLAKITYLPVDDNNTAYNMYLNGEADYVTQVPLDVIESAMLRDDYQNAPYLGTYYYAFNMEKAPFDDVRVRKALAMAIDKETLTRAVSKGGEQATDKMVPDMSGYPGITGNGYDVAKAQALLAEAGYPNGEGFPSFSIIYNTNEAHKKIGEYIQQQWQENLGIACDLENQEWKTYLASKRQGEFLVARAGWIGDYQDPNTFLDMFVAGGAMNDPNFVNAEFDGLLKEAASMEPGSARANKMVAAEELFITEHQAVIPIYHYTTKQMIDLSIWGGWHNNVMDWHPTKYIHKK